MVYLYVIIIDMKNKISTLILLASAVILSSCGANYYLSKGNKDFKYTHYVKAIDNYNRCLSKKEITEARINLAHAYRLTNKIQDAEREYAKVATLSDADPIILFYYAKVLMQMEKYEEAKANFKLYLEKEPDDFVAKMLLKSCNSISTVKFDTTQYSLLPVDPGNTTAMFGCVSYKDGMVCTAERDVWLDAKKNPWTGNSYLDLYFSQKDENGKWISPRILKGQLNGQYHEGPATFNKAGDIVYFTRSNYFKGEVRKSSKGINNLKIFRAELVNNRWAHIEEMPFNNDEYSVGHPSLAPDEKTLYFVSDMPGGYGGTDIYLSFYDGGKWSPPMNLGPNINTPGNEMFPFSGEDGSFYFASDAHNSMGGLDVFITSYDGKKWLRPENMNYPLNSSKDDFAVFMKDDSTGYVSSSRSDTDRVYEFTMHPPKFTLSGLVIDSKTHQPINDATVKIMGDARTVLSVDKDGKYNTPLKHSSNYLVIASAPGHFSRSEQVRTFGMKISKSLTLDFSLHEMILEKPIILENIYYDLDKWEIRPDAAKELDNLVKILNDNPTIHIEMGSHTDSRAGDQYNLILSDKRAKAAVGYLVAKGIDAQRLSWKGYGESLLVNKCANNVVCTEAEHQNNRRTEFKVTKIESK